MSEKMEQSNTINSSLNSILWVLIIALLVGGIGANYYFSEIAWSLRLAGWILLICILLALTYQTTQGKKLWVFANAAKMELRKVVWPTREETTKITMVIAALVVLMALILWGADSVLLWAIGWITGQHG